uniref:ALIX V-shaped domain-containing protein n=1 Tax=Eptatretus burgeri TaxID=7764 RepID=A0A8C4WXZ1_EPTBU
MFFFSQQVVQELHSLLDQLETIKNEREGIESELRSVEADMTSCFLEALAQDGALDEEQLSQQEIERLYGTVRQRVGHNIQQQDGLLRQLQLKHQEFSQHKQASAESNLREDTLKQLATAHDGFMDLLSNLVEGTKFYNDLTEILLKFQSKCNDIVFARKTERDELLKDIQANIANSASAPSMPSIPTYQSPENETKAGPQPLPRSSLIKPQAPPRPPPPKTTTTPQPPFSTAAPAHAPYSPPNVYATPFSGAAASVPVSYMPVTSHVAQNPPFPSFPTYPSSMPMPPMPMGFNPYMTYPYASPQYGYPPAGQPPNYPVGPMPGFPQPQTGYPQAQAPPQQPGAYPGAYGGFQQ